MHKIRLSRKEKDIVRRKVYERALESCEECFRWVRYEAGFWDSMHLAHIKSKGAGGEFTEANTRCLCMNCHLISGHNPKSVPSKV